MNNSAKLSGSLVSDIKPLVPCHFNTAMKWYILLILNHHLENQGFYGCLFHLIRLVTPGKLEKSSPKTVFQEMLKIKHIFLGRCKTKNNYVTLKIVLYWIGFKYYWFKYIALQDFIQLSNIFIFKTKYKSQIKQFLHKKPKLHEYHDGHMLCCIL